MTRPARRPRLLAGRRSERGEQGYAAVLVALVVATVGVGCLAVGIDSANWYVQVQKVQKAADAAALAGVPFLPQDMAAARARALEVARANGYDNDGTTNAVAVTAGAKATQLKVTISARTPNQFGAIFGATATRITRSGTADYQGPAPMGSPCNTFGNEPNPGNVGNGTTGSARPLGSVQAPSMSTYCTRTPQFWATVEGPGTGKVQGDRYQTRGCEDTGVDGCTGTTNSEYDPFGYTFMVKVDQAAVGQPVKLQLYDPMFVNTAADCSLLPSRTVWATLAAANLGLNAYVTARDAYSRYSSDVTSSSRDLYNFGLSSSFCTGDSYPGDGTGKTVPEPLTTSFVLRQQDDSQNPGLAPVQNDTVGKACIKQYGSYSTTRTRVSRPFNTIGTALLTASAAGFNDDVAASLHNWMDFCTFTPSRAGDYYLQVRTNVSLAGTTRSSAGLIRSGNTAALGAPNTTSGEGSNSFAIRAVTPAGLEHRVSVSGYEHMPIYINADAATATFHLIRVLPGAAGQKISFSYFDAGDAQGSGSVTVLTPDDGKDGTIALSTAGNSVKFPGGCTTYGGSAGGSQTNQTTLSNCSAPISKQSSSSTTSKNNGKVQTITIPIPANYSCTTTSYSGCWYKVRVTFGSSSEGDASVTDVTTWDATVIGDPVRLVE